MTIRVANKLRTFKTLEELIVETKLTKKVLKQESRIKIIRHHQNEFIRARYYWSMLPSLNAVFKTNKNSTIMSNWHFNTYYFLPYKKPVMKYVTTDPDFNMVFLYLVNTLDRSELNYASNNFISDSIYKFFTTEEFRLSYKDFYEERYEIESKLSDLFLKYYMNKPTQKKI